MALEVELTTDVLPIVAAGVAMLGLAVALLYVNPRHRLNRAFAVFLVVRGISNVLVPVIRPLDDPMQIATLGGGVDMTLVFAALHFGLAYRETEHGARYPGWVPGALVAGAVATFAVWLVAPELGPVFETGSVEVFRAGPVFALTSLAYGTVLAIIGALLAHDAVHAESPSVRTSSLLLSVAFLAWPVYLGLFESLSNIGGVPAETVGFTSEAGGLVPVATTVFALYVAAGVAAIAYLYRSARDRAWLLRRTRLVAIALLVVMLAALLPYQMALLDVGSPASRRAVANVVSGLVLLVMPLLGFYALVRHQVFGADLKVKFAIRQSTVAAIFLAVFFAASEGAAAFFGERLDSTYLGIAAAALLVLVLAPLQRVADRVADVAMPGVKRTEELSPPEKADLYRDQARFAWSDGQLTRDERAMLDRLRTTLGLSAERASNLEQEVLDTDPGSNPG